MSVADKRIVIRNESTGEKRHAIAGHIPSGWIAIKAVRDDSLASGSVANREAGNSHAKDVQRDVPSVRSKEGGNTGRGVSARPSSVKRPSALDRK